MSRATPLLPHPGVPDEFIQQINARFRQIGAGTAATGTAAGGRGPAGPPGTPGTSGSGVALIQRQLLVHSAVTTITAPVASGDGQLLTVLLTQPSNALGEVLWDNTPGNFSANTPTDINTTTNDSVASLTIVWSAVDNLWLFLWMNAGGTI